MRVRNRRSLGSLQRRRGRAGQAAITCSPWSKMVAAAITPTSDALIVLTNGGKLSRALGVHGLTAGLLVAAGLILALG